MKLVVVLVITVIMLLIFLYEWPKIEKGQKKERAAFVTLTTIGLLLSILLVFFPEIPGPSELLSNLFYPFGQMLDRSRS
ncbi:hypothetical protein [Bacillus sp. V5-8f]|uniref:hypothetical protein n=1 Tax=Bacillus sp. V5-8f TaxID=2053044 RepID=UPI000C76CC90|nr:hypothetical protein [Bacillus sp. V5-8f]PLT35412.1 hypothetical protein CUU64_02020 [Bacillus sp. V5-8f]